MIDAGFDFDLQVERAALNRGLRGFLAALQANQPLFRQPLGGLAFLGFNIALGTLELGLPTGEILALRPRGATRHGLEADFALQMRLALRGVQIMMFGIPLLTRRDITADVQLAFDGIGVDVITTPQGVPHQLALVIRNLHLNRPQVLNTTGLGGMFTTFLQGILTLLTPAINAGLFIASSLVRSIPITVREMIDAFAWLGVRFHKPGSPARDSPFITALADSLLVAADFQRLAPPPAGNPAQLGDIRAPGNNVAVVLGQSGLNQAIDVLVTKGIIPSTFRTGGFKFSLKRLDVTLLGAGAAGNRPNPLVPAALLGAIQIDVELRGKRGRCACKIKVTVYIRVRIWPYMDAAAPPAPVSGALTLRQSPATLRFFFDDRMRVKVQGFLVAVAEILLGPLLAILLFSVSQLANLILPVLLPYTYTKQMSGSTLSLTFSSAQVNTYLTLRFAFVADLHLEGEGFYELDQFSGYRLPLSGPSGPLPVDTENLIDLKVDYNLFSIEIQDQEIRLAANILRE